MNYEKEFELKDPSYRSSTLTNGLARSGQRALLYATGMDEEDLKKPFVAVIGSFSEMVPGHAHLRELADYVCQGVIEAGGVPRRSETIAICDGLCQGHKGMRYPLATPDYMKEAEKATLPTVGSCAHLGTANSMCMLSEVLGMALPGAGTAPAVSNKRKRIAKASGRAVMQLLREGITPRKILTREALLNGVAGAMATGSSTNLVLHLMALAHEAGVELNLSDFDRISREVPFVCNLQPSGKYPIVSLDASGGIPAVLKTVEPRLHREVMTVAGKTLGELLDGYTANPDDVLKTLEAPQKPEGGIAVLYGSLAPRGAVVKQSGVRESMAHFTGKARVFDSMEEADAAVSAGTIEKGTVIVIRYEGPKGGPGMREMLSTTALIMGRGMDEDVALVTDGRFSGATHGPCIGHISPEAAAGGPIAFVQDGDEIEIDIHTRTLELHVPAEELERRKEGWQPLRKPRLPALAKYAALVSSADTGAILDTASLG